jgi:hypothetical protein
MSANVTFDLRTAASITNIDQVIIDHDVAGTRLIVGNQIARTADVNTKGTTAGDGILGDLLIAYRGWETGTVPMQNGIFIDGRDVGSTETFDH